MTARPIRRNAQTPDRNGKIFYTSTTSLSHISKYTGDKTTEIVDYMLLYVDKTSKYETDAISYTKHLIKANNNQITDSEIETLLEDVKSKPNSGETSNNGKGISIGYTENDETYQFQVLRLYK